MARYSLGAPSAATCTACPANFYAPRPGTTACTPPVTLSQATTGFDVCRDYLALPPSIAAPYLNGALETATPSTICYYKTSPGDSGPNMQTVTAACNPGFYGAGITGQCTFRAKCTNSGPSYLPGAIQYYMGTGGVACFTAGMCTNGCPGVCTMLTPGTVGCGPVGGTAGTASSQVNCGMAIDNGNNVTAGLVYNGPTFTTLSGGCTACAAGFYSSAQGAAGCSPCSAGIFCPAAAVAGRAGASSNTVTCPAGWYCPAGAAPVPCPAGTYSSATGQATVATCAQCPDA